MLTAEQHRRIADELAAAERDRAPIEPLVGRYAGIGAADAYTLQLMNIERRVSAGATVVGHKVGLSSLAMQQMMGVDEPDYGHLLDDMRASESEPATPPATAIRGWSPKSGSSSAPICPASRAPRRTCWRRPRRTRPRWS